MSESRRIVLTGASRGLGRAMLEGFIELGHTVYGCSRSAEAVADLTQRFHALGKFSAVDVADDAAVERWAKSVLADGGPPDLLLNNAAIMNSPAPLWEVPLEEFRAMTAVNINGVYYVLRHFTPAMIAAGRGIIVNFTSGWGRSISPDVAPYCATKWAIEGLTRAMAEELPKGMAAIPLNPGIIDTDMLRTAWAEGAAAYPSPAKWAKKVVPFLLNLTAKDNGRPLTAPG
jgi:NAD(P)-dependent dehydrogenase (short-subunit alcohol dehydrogenase family)